MTRQATTTAPIDPHAGITFAAGSALVRIHLTDTGSYRVETTQGGLLADWTRSYTDKSEAVKALNHVLNAFRAHGTDAGIERRRQELVGIIAEQEARAAELEYDALLDLGSHIRMGQLLADVEDFLTDAAVEQSGTNLDGYTATQAGKARDLINEDAIIPTNRAGVYRAVSSNGAEVYLTTADSCTCPAARHGRACYHRAAATILNAAPTRGESPRANRTETTLSIPQQPMSRIPVVSRCKQWRYEMITHSNTVHTVTHLPSSRSLLVCRPIKEVRENVRSGEMLRQIEIS